MTSLLLSGLWLAGSNFTPTIHPGEEYAPANGEFSIRFPGKPRETAQTATSPIGDLKVHTATYATSEGNVYVVTYTDFPKAATRPEVQGTLFDGVLEGLKGKDGKLLKTAEKKEFTIGSEKFPGREWQIEKGKQRLRFRVILRERRLYQIGVVGAMGFTSGKSADGFFESFEFKSEP